MNLDKVKLIRNVLFIAMFIYISFVFIMFDISDTIFEYSSEDGFSFMGGSIIVLILFILLLIPCIVTSVIVYKNDDNYEVNYYIKLLSYITLALFVLSIVGSYFYNGHTLTSDIVYALVSINASAAIVSNFYTLSLLTWV